MNAGTFSQPVAQVSTLVLYITPRHLQSVVEPITNLITQTGTRRHEALGGPSWEGAITVSYSETARGHGVPVLTAILIHCTEHMNLGT